MGCCCSFSPECLKEPSLCQCCCQDADWEKIICKKIKNNAENQKHCREDEVSTAVVKYSTLEIKQNIVMWLKLVLIYFLFNL